MKRIMFLWLFLSALVGCSTMGESLVSSQVMEPPSGSISPWVLPVSNDLNLKNLESGHMSPDMNYYYSAAPHMPPAVIEISKDYRMDDAHWKPVTDSEMLVKYIEIIKLHGSNGAQGFSGFDMRAPDNRLVGTWYSYKYVAGLKLKLSDDLQVSFYVPL